MVQLAPAAMYAACSSVVRTPSMIPKSIGERASARVATDTSSGRTPARWAKDCSENFQVIARQARAPGPALGAPAERPLDSCTTALVHHRSLSIALVPSRGR